MTTDALVGMEAWAADTYSRFPASYWSVDDNGRGAEVARAVAALIAQDDLPPLGPASHVFESGCNMGQCLWALQQQYGCRVSGLDLSPRAVAFARRVLGPTIRGENALTSAWLAARPDQAFDLVLTRWHLVHLPPSARKHAYVAHLQRIGRASVFFEPWRRDCADRPVHDPGMLMIMESWARYGLREVDVAPAWRVAGTRIYLGKG